MKNTLPNKLITSLLILVLPSFSGCSSETNHPAKTWREIQGRDSLLIYRAHTPAHWIYKNISKNLADTTQSLCEFHTQDIRITIHNFPTEALTERIPPFAQIERWKRQIHALNQASVSVTPQAHGGFLGFRFEGENEKEKTIAYIMQLSREHYQTLQRDPSSVQKRADYTIKIVGPKDQIESERESIHLFARSFELIEEIPSYDD